MNIRYTASVVSAALLSACASQLPSSVEYGSVYATITDSGFSENSVRDHMFAVTAIDGVDIINVFNDANRKRMLTLNVNPPFTGRRVPVKPMSLKLRGAVSGSAPIVGLVGAVTGARSIEGTVRFVPKEGVFYIVAGELSGNRSCVWIEEEKNPTPVSEKLCTN